MQNVWCIWQDVGMWHFMPSSDTVLKKIPCESRATHRKYNCHVSPKFLGITDTHTHRPCFMPVCFMPFCFKCPYQFMTLNNLCPLIYSSMSFSWLCSILLTPYFWQKYHFLFMPTSSGTQLGCKTRPCCICIFPYMEASSGCSLGRYMLTVVPHIASCCGNCLPMCAFRKNWSNFPSHWQLTRWIQSPYSTIANRYML